MNIYHLYKKFLRKLLHPFLVLSLIGGAFIFGYVLSLTQMEKSILFENELKAQLIISPSNVKYLIIFDDTIEPIVVHTIPLNVKVKDYIRKVEQKRSQKLGIKH